MNLERQQQQQQAGKRVRVCSIQARPPWTILAEHWNSLPTGSTQSQYDLEFGILRSGRLRRFQGKHCVDIGPGEVWLNGMWESCNWEVLEPCREMVFAISPEVLVGQHFPEVPGLHWLMPFMVSPPLRPRVPEAERPRVQALTELAAQLHRKQHQNTVQNPSSPSKVQEFFKPHAGAIKVEPRAPEAICLRMRLIVTELLLLLLEDWQPPLASRAEPFAQINPAILRVLQSQHAVTTQEAAHLCGLNRNLFARRFHDSMGLSFSQFDLRHRLNGAESDLLKGRETLKVIAARWGFADGPHLHSCFVRHYGCTPAQFRREPPPSLRRWPS